MADSRIELFSRTPSGVRDRTEVRVPSRRGDSLGPTGDAVGGLGRTFVRCLHHLRQTRPRKLILCGASPFLLCNSARTARDAGETTRQNCRELLLAPCALGAAPIELGNGLPRGARDRIEGHNPQLAGQPAGASRYAAWRVRPAVREAGSVTPGPSRPRELILRGASPSTYAGWCPASVRHAERMFSVKTSLRAWALSRTSSRSS